MKRLYLLIISALLLFAVFCGCTKIPAETESPVTHLTQTVQSADDLAALENYPNLQEADLRGSDCYSDILSYIKSHPQVTVIYDVALAGARYPMDVEALTLEDGTFSLQELLDVVPYLPNLKSVTLPLTTLGMEALDSLEVGLGEISLSYSVDILGSEVTPGTESLDLSALSTADLDQMIQTLKVLPGLNHIRLTDENGQSGLTVADVKKMAESFPEVTLEYTFELFGVTINTADERVEFLNIPIGNEGIAQIREALDILPNCTYLLMDTCGVDNEIMAQLREDYAEKTKVVWRVWLVEEDYNSKLYMRTGSYLTDTHRIRTTYVNDENSHILNYCTETKYVDVGHVWQLTQCEFLAYMPDLEVCIIAITEITDITPLANHEKLEYLELFTTDISDISPLLTCPNIEHLNLSNMPYLDDITPVYSLKKLKRLRMVDSPLISDEEKQRAKEELPDCNHLNMGNFATAWGWRYLDAAKENPDPRYALLCEQMEYEIDAWEYGIP